MLASLYSLFGNTEKYDKISGSILGMVIFLVGLIATFTVYSIYLVDTSLDNKPLVKNERLRIIIIAGFTFSLIIALFTGFSVNRYNFCKMNKDICIVDYSFSPFG